MAASTQEVSSATNAKYGEFLGQYINGKWRNGKSADRLSDLNPFSGKQILELPTATLDDLDEAYTAAARAQTSWAQALPVTRATVMLKAAEIMEARKEEIIDWIIRESGSTRIKAGVEWQFVWDCTRQAASYPYRAEGRIIPIDVRGKESRVYRRPLGVVGVISPWNFPMYLSQRTIGPALALGNAVVVKPAEDTPVTGGLLIAKIFEEAGLPPGVLNVVVGTPAVIGDAFTLHRIPKLISFTGSTKVGKRLASLAATGDTLKKVSLELGGNAPQVVLDDADVDLAVRAAVFGRFLHQGQICMSTNRIIVDAKVYPEFVEKFVAHVKTLKCGDPNDPSTVIGPVINKRQLDSMLKQIGDANSRGLHRVVGSDPVGQVLPPHVFIDVKNDDPLAQAELFGPIVPLIKAREEDDALRLANETPYGLSSSVFSRDERRALAFALRVEAGMTHINDQSVNDSAPNPFGGEKNSGIGRFGADWLIGELTTDHWITVQHEALTYPF